jgi:hypothetical protein
MIYGSKIVMLSDIFDSLRAPCALLAPLFQLYMTLKPPQDILFHDDDSAGTTNNFYITGLKLFVVMDKLSDSQLTIETARMADRQPLTRVGYRRFDTITQVHAPSNSYITNGIKNLLGSVLMFSSTACEDGLGVNPYQYCYGWNGTAHSGLAYYRHRYGAIVYPISGQVVETVNCGRNTEMFEIWRTLSRMIADNGKTFTTPIDFMTNVGLPDVAPPVDLSSYVFFPAVFCNQDAAPMRTAAGFDHEIVTTGGHAAGGIIIRIRLNAYAIDCDTMVTIMD